MIWVYEFAAMAVLGGVVWVLFLAARERPDQTGLRRTAYVGLGAWGGFVLWSLVRAGIFDDPGALARSIAIIAVIAAAILGYRRLLTALRERHGDR